MDDNEIFSVKNEELDLNRDLEFDVPREVIKVIGVGGAGGNALNTLIRSGADDVDFIAANTDVAALRLSLAKDRLILGRNLTKGRGAGSNPEVGENAAKESEEEISKLLEGSDMVFITAGMGGGTGTGASPIIAGIAREKSNALVVGIVTFPFSWEGSTHIQKALEGIKKLREKVDALIVVHNDRIVELSDKSTTVTDAFLMSDEVLRQAVAGVTRVIRTVMEVNVDFADVCAVMSNAGSAIMGVGEAKGEGRVTAAARLAMNGPLMTQPMNGASAVLYTIEYGDELTMQELDEAAKLVAASARQGANIIWGRHKDDSLGETLRFTLIATGFNENSPAKAEDGEAPTDTNPFGRPQQPLTPGDVVSEGGSGSIFDGLFGKGNDIPATYRRRKK